MTTEEAKELLVEGKEIQRDSGGTDGWVTVRTIWLDEPRERYRLKPEPREFWITDNPDCAGRRLASPTLRDADCSCVDGVEIIHVREVL